MAEAYGMNRTAKTLRLNYYGLKKRVDQQGAGAVGAAEAEGEAPFVELAPLPSASCLRVSSGVGERRRSKDANPAEGRRDA